MGSSGSRSGEKSFKEPINKLLKEEYKNNYPNYITNPFFEQALQNVIDTHYKKNKDYAESNNPFSNFEDSAKSAGIETWQSFEALIGTKEARLRHLMKKQEEEEPLNEPVLDTYKDRAVYAILAYAYQLMLVGKVASKAYIR